MTISSLNNLSVPITGQTPATSGLLMPKLQFKFRVNFTSFGASGSDTVELTRQVMDVTRPSVSFDDVTLNIYNSKVRLAGRHSWEDITLNLRDDTSGIVQKLVGQQLQKQVDFQEQKTAAAGSNYKFLTKIEILDGGNGNTAPVVLETWELYGCYLTTANYNALNYATSDPVTIALSIRYDNAVQSEGTKLESGSTLAVGADSAPKTA